MDAALHSWWLSLLLLLELFSTGIDVLWTSISHEVWWPIPVTIPSFVKHIVSKYLPFQVNFRFKSICCHLMLLMLTGSCRLYSSDIWCNYSEFNQRLAVNLNSVSSLSLGSAVWVCLMPVINRYCSTAYGPVISSPCVGWFVLWKCLFQQPAASVCTSHFICICIWLIVQYLWYPCFVEDQRDMLPSAWQSVAHVLSCWHFENASKLQVTTDCCDSWQFDGVLKL